MRLAHSLRLHDWDWRRGLTFVRSVHLLVPAPGDRRPRPVRTRPSFTAKPSLTNSHFPSIFSVDLSFFHAPEDLVTKLVDCLVRLPNLKTLEILSAGSRAPISKALKRKYAVFPSIRELRITPACHHFVRKCPNLDSLIFTSTMDTHAPSTIRSHGGGLKRLAGVTVYDRNVLHCGSLKHVVLSNSRSEAFYHRGHVGLPEPSRDWRRRQHQSEYIIPPGGRGGGVGASLPHTC
jgi:hypothetical protein